jgi:hypothetical protein
MHGEYKREREGERDERGLRENVRMKELMYGSVSK